MSAEDLTSLQPADSGAGLALSRSVPWRRRRTGGAGRMNPIVLRLVAILAFAVLPLLVGGFTITLFSYIGAGLAQAGHQQREQLGDQADLGKQGQRRCRGPIRGR